MTLTAPLDRRLPEPSHPRPSRPGHWVDGGWIGSTSTTTLPVVDPATEQVVALVPDGSAADVDAAVAAARRAQPAWAALSLGARRQLLGDVLDVLEAHSAELVELVVAEVGAPVRVAEQAQVGLALGIARSFLAVAEEHPFERQVGNSYVRGRPLGVAACITPWNVPLLMAMQKITPALVTGCTVVHKPSELTPLSALRVAELASAAGLPPGVLNVVIGTGEQVGAHLAEHPGVDVISLTGSTRAGRSVAAAAAARLVPAHLELGGKSASVVLPDADLPAAVRATVEQVCFNTGQTCLQWSRLLVPADRQEEAAALAAAAVATFAVGDPHDRDTDLGPLVSAAARERVQGYIATGVAEGARLVAGGLGAPPGLDRGYYVRPTVFTDVEPAMTIAQEEIFGPVLSIIGYDDEDAALDIANGTAYGLHGAVWSASNERALAFAERLETGQVDINGGPFNPLAPFGGFKASGLGRECGTAGLSAFVETTAFQLPDARAAASGPRLRGADQ